jgi:hypothetical protein
MNKEVKKFLKEFDKTIKECEKFCFISRGRVFQQDAVNTLKALKQKALYLKEKAIKK